MNGQSVANALQSGHDTASRVIQAHGAIVDLN